ncbi:MAG: hypothetical protein AAGI07_05285 [Bacteroidota bacterium]
MILSYDEFFTMYQLRFLIVFLSLFACAEKESEVIVEAQLGRVLFDAKTDQVLIEGDISSVSLFTLEGSKVSLDGVEIRRFGHAIFENTTANTEIDLTIAERSSERHSGSTTNFLSRFGGLNSQTTYYAITYAEAEGINDVIISKEKEFTLDELDTVNAWDTQPITFTGENRLAPVSFGVGEIAYVGTGFSTGQFGGKINYKDFWGYNTETGTWSELNRVDDNFEGRFNAIAFVVENDAYIGLGTNSIGTTTSPENTNSFNDLWKFTPSTNQWQQITMDYPGTGTSRAIVVVVGDKAYVGLGSAVANNGSSTLVNEFYEYNTSTGIWTAKADFIGDLRFGASAFAIGNKVYYGLGGRRIEGPSIGDGINYLRDFYEYNTDNNTWRQLNDLPIAFRRAEAGGFSYNGKGYLVAGRRSLLEIAVFKDFLEYDPNTDSWGQLSDYPGTARYSPCIAKLSDKVLVGLGNTGFGGNRQDFYTYIPYIPNE